MYIQANFCFVGGKEKKLIIPKQELNIILSEVILSSDIL